MIEGDTIHIGTSIPVRIMSVDYKNNTITINKTLSWKSNQGIYLPYSGLNPDLGAHEYKEINDNGTIPLERSSYQHR